MPVVEAHVLNGYAPDAKRRLVRALTDAVRFVVPAPDKAITVMVHEYPAENYGRGGERRQPAPALPDPAQVVMEYLTAMEARDLNGAQRLMAETFTMTFPGTGPMTSLQQLIDWAQDRYRFVTKAYGKVEAFHTEGVAVVYARGTLTGAWPDGTPFDGIRFIDRFEVKDGLLVCQDVWNDLAEVRATCATT